MAKKLLLCFLVFLSFIYFGFEVLASLSIAYTIFTLMELFLSFGKKIPFIELTTTLLSVQLLLSPFLDYYVFKNEVFGIMKVDPYTYFSYLLPCLIASHLALRLIVGKSELKFTDYVLNRFKDNAKYYRKMGQILIGVGYLFYFVLLLEIPLSLGFLLSLFAFFRFIGFIIIWLSGSKHTHFYFLIVFLPFAIQVLNETIFIDLIIWSIFLFSIYTIKNKVNYYVVAPLAGVAFFFLIIFQSVKMTYRMQLWYGGQETTTLSNVALISNLVYEQLSDLDFEKLRIIGGAVNVRFNQGWIVSDILENVPKKVPYSGWYFLKKEIKGILLPRIIYPNKLLTKNNEKFDLYVGYELADEVAMDLGIPGDGYGAFGKTGGIFFCFVVFAFYGFCYRLCNKLFHRYPEILVWNIAIFFYLFRAGNEFYIITNWIVKVGLFILLMLFVFNNVSIKKVLFKPNVTGA